MDAQRREPSSVRLFASVDLIGSTAYKNIFSGANEYADGGGPPWAHCFKRFYFRFTEILSALPLIPVGSLVAGTPSATFEFLKGIGDELVYSQEIKNHLSALQLTLLFRDALRAYNEELFKEKKPVAVKGAMWIAGFPINNTKIPNPAVGDSAQPGADYIGPSIDTGFRVAKYASKRRLAITADLALLLTASPRIAEKHLKIYFDGLESLKGVLSEKAYPLIWILSDESDIEERLYGVRKENCGLDVLHDYCKDYITACEKKTWLIRPYLPGDELFTETPQWHQDVMKEWKAEDERQSVGSGEIEPAANVPTLEEAQTEKSMDELISKKLPSDFFRFHPLPTPVKGKKRKKKRPGKGSLSWE